jgi:hypothetical protein
MELFFAMSGIAGANLGAVTAALKQYAEEHDGQMDPTPAIGDSSEYLVAFESCPDRVAVTYPAKFTDWDIVSEYLSRTLDAPAFWFHVPHDGQWFYCFFERGEYVDLFNTLQPDSWDDYSGDERSKIEAAKWKGDATRVAAHWPGVKPESVERYLVPWKEDGSLHSKAYADDQFASGDARQLFDFLRCLGLEFPIDDRGRPRGKTYRFHAELVDSRRG